MYLHNLLKTEKDEFILYYFYAYTKGYGRDIARLFDYNLLSVQKIILRLELAGIICGMTYGKTRLYEFDRRYPFYKELQALIKAAFDALPPEIEDKYFLRRNKPRRTGKPLFLSDVEKDRK